MNLSRFIWGARRKVNGAKPDVRDRRDVYIQSAGLVSTAPHGGHTLDHGFESKDQDGTGSCCGQGVANAVRDAYLANDIDCPELSALYAYYASRRMWTRKPSDNGTSVRDTIKALKRFGIATEFKWPMMPSRVNRRPYWSAFHSAMDRRGIRGYYRIPKGDLNGVRSAIAAGMPVVGWWRVDSAFMRLGYPGTVGPCRLPFIGNHCMEVPTFYENGDFGIVNSWGARWRHNGRQRVTGAFVQEMNDGWAIDIRSR
jgi:hypothetical protein